jgi:hypothetical protein
MVEAAFMMPMFVLLFFTSIYAHNLNAKQISLNITTRGNSWGYAMNNCGVGGDDETETLPSGVSATTVSLFGESGNDTESAASTALSSGNTTGAISSISSGVTGAISSVLPNPNGSQAQIIDSVSWRQPNVWSGNLSTGAATVRQTVTVVCDQEPHNGNIETAVQGIVCAITGHGC